MSAAPNSLSYAQPGDDLAVRMPGLIGWLTRKALSGAIETCWSSHNSQFIQRDGYVDAFHMRPDRNRVFTLYAYEAWLKDLGSDWVLTRPAWVHQTEPEIVTPWRQQYSAWILKHAKDDYPEASICALGLNIILRPLISHGWIKPNKTTFHCTAMGVTGWRSTAIAWEPAATRNIPAYTVAPLHIERAMREGDMVLVAESKSGTFDKIVYEFGG